MGYRVTITRQPLRAAFDLKGAREMIVDWCGKALPPFPARPNSLTVKGDRRLMWTGPDHWLLTAPIAEEGALNAALAPEKAPTDISLVLVSDTLAHVTVTGPDAGEVMAVATPLDLHPDAFPADGATWTEAFGVKALVRRVDGGFEVAVDRSYGDWLGTYLDKVAD